MHDASGSTTAAYTGRYSAGDVSGDLTLTKTTDVFATPGRFTSNGDNGMIFTSGTLFDLLAELFETKTPGTLFIFARLTSGTPISTGYLFSVNDDASASLLDPGYGLRIFGSGAEARIRTRMYDGGFLATAPGAELIPTDGTLFAVGAYMYCDGDKTGMSVISNGATGVSNDAYAVCETVSGVSLFGALNSSLAIKEQMAATTGVADLIFIRTPRDARRHFCRLHTAHARSHGEITRAFEVV